MSQTRLASRLSRTLLDTIDEIVYALDLDGDPLTGGRVTFVNSRVKDVLGYAPEEFMADSSLWLRLVHPADRPAVERSSLQIVESGQPGRRHFRLRHRTLDTYLWFEDSVVPQFGPDGTLTGFVGAARDVTAQRRVAQQMAVLLENTRDGFFTLDHAGRCTFANPAGVRMFDRRATEILGRFFLDLLNEPERTIFRQNHERAVREGGVVRASGYCHSLKRWLDTAIFPSPDGAMVNLRDVTEQHTSEERLRTWVDDAPVGLFRTVPFGRMLDANGTALTMLGCPNLETLREQQSLDLVAELGADDLPRIDLALFEGISGMPITLKRIDGTEFPALMNLRALRDHAGQVVEMLGSFEDRRDPAALRSALLSGARRYRILFDENVTPMLVTTVEGALVTCNQAFLRLLGRTPGAGDPGGTLADHMSEPDAAGMLIARTLESGGVEGMEVTLRRADGTTRRALASSRVAMESPQAAVVETSFVDIEDRSRVEDQLRRTVEQREFLMRELHHRVKNNLQLISSLLSLQAREAGGPAIYEFAQKTRDRILAMAVVHERLYRTEEMGSACIKGYLEALTSNLAESYDAEARGISLEVSGACVQMTLDQTMRCGLIVNELVMNALRHAFERQGGTVRVQVDLDPREPSRVRITVSDTGRGLPDRFDAGRVSSLGIQMVQNLARQSGGSASWTSGPGTTVTVELMLATADSEGSAEPEGGTGYQKPRPL